MDTRRAVAMLVLACTRTTGDVTIGPVGPAGPAGPTGPSGPPGPAGASPRAVKVATAAGQVLGPVLGFTYGADGYLPDLPVYVEALGRLGHLDQRTGRLSPCSAVFASADCTGPAYTGGNITPDMACEDGSRVLSATTRTPESITVACTRDARGCLSFPPGAVSVYPTAELTDSRYPYAAPLRVTYE